MTGSIVDLRRARYMPQVVDVVGKAAWPLSGLENRTQGKGEIGCCGGEQRELHRHQHDIGTISTSISISISINLGVALELCTVGVSWPDDLPVRFGHRLRSPSGERNSIFPSVSVRRHTRPFPLFSSLFCFRPRVRQDHRCIVSLWR